MISSELPVSLLSCKALRVQTLYNRTICVLPSAVLSQYRENHSDLYQYTQNGVEFAIAGTHGTKFSFLVVKTRLHEQYYQKIFLHIKQQPLYYLVKDPVTYILIFTHNCDVNYITIRTFEVEGKIGNIHNIAGVIDKSIHPSLTNNMTTE